MSLVSLGTILVVVKADAPFSDLQRHGRLGEGPRPAGDLRQLGHRLVRPSLRPDVRAGAGRPYSHVPYRGDVPAMQDVANGALDITWASPTSAKPQIDGRPREAARRRRLQALGVDAASCRPLPSSSSRASISACSLRPMRRPERPSDRRPPAARIKAAISEPEVAEKMIAQGQTPVGSTPKELAEMLSRETPIWAELIRQSGAKVE